MSSNAGGYSSSVPSFQQVYTSIIFFFWGYSNACSFLVIPLDFFGICGIFFSGLIQNSN